MLARGHGVPRKWRKREKMGEEMDREREREKEKERRLSFVEKRSGTVFFVTKC